MASFKDGKVVVQYFPYAEQYVEGWVRYCLVIDGEMQDIGKDFNVQADWDATQVLELAKLAYNGTGEIVDIPAMGIPEDAA